MSSPYSDGVAVSDLDAIRTITLNRPEKLNAFDSEMEAGVVQALYDARDDGDLGAVVLTGAGRGFCSGHDWGETGGGGGGPRGPGADASEVNRIPQAILQLGKPVIGAINGVTAGGGLAIALSCDLRVASTAATFQELHVHRGIVPAIETWLLPRSVGLSRAMQMTITGAKLDAKTAAEWGLVAAVTEPEALLDEARSLAQAAAALPANAFALTKRAMLLAAQSSLHDTLQYVSAARTVGAYSGEYGRGARSFQKDPVHGDAAQTDSAQTRAAPERHS